MSRNARVLQGITVSSEIKLRYPSAKRDDGLRPDLKYQMRHPFPFLTELVRPPRYHQDIVLQLYQGNIIFLHASVRQVHTLLLHPGGSISVAKWIYVEEFSRKGRPVSRCAILQNPQILKMWHSASKQSGSQRDIMDATIHSH